MRTAFILAVSLLASTVGAQAALAQQSEPSGSFFIPGHNPDGRHEPLIISARPDNFARPAQPDELRVGDTVRDPQGRYIGRIASAGSGGVVIHSGNRTATIPLRAFRINRSGPMIGISRSAFRRLAVPMR